jgi:uncharacterized protein YdcH (DUF465 family)
MEIEKILLLTHEKALLFDGEKLEPSTAKESGHYKTGLAIPSTFVDTFSFKLPKSLSDDELVMQVEIKMYKEGGLNVDAEYTIDFIHYDIDDHDYLIEAFAISKEKFQELTQEYKKDLVAVDYAFIKFLIYQTLYDELLDPSKNDLFIYINDNEAFGVIYKDGKYIGHRTLNSLSSLSKRTGIELAKLKEYLQEKGLIKTNYSYDEMHILDQIQEILLKDIEKLIYSINHKRSVFGFTSLDNVYVDFYNQTLEGLEDFFTPFGYSDLHIEAIPLKQEDTNVDVQTYIESKYLYDLVHKKEMQTINISHLERGKPLKEYLAFWYIGILLTTLIVCGAIFTYFFMEQNSLDKTITAKEQKLELYTKKSKKLLKKLKSIKDENKILSKKLQKAQKSIFFYETTLSAIPMIELQKHKREAFMNDVVSALKKYQLTTQYIKQIDLKTMEIMLISKSYKRDTIAKFINELIAKGYSSVSINEITEEDGIYNGIVRVVQ